MPFAKFKMVVGSKEDYELGRYCCATEVPINGLSNGDEHFLQQAPDAFYNSTRKFN